MSAIFNIFGKVQEEITDFDTRGIYIVGKPDSAIEFREARGRRGGYWFSQKEMLESIDLACASKYKKGITDEEGQRKTFINIVNFYRDVMKMKININVSNYIFEPTTSNNTWIVWLLDRMFKLWARINSYDDQIDAFAHDLATYGSVVVMKLKDCTDRIPLRTLRNTPTARTLFEAANAGGYVIIEDEKHYNEMKKYPNWDIKGLSKHKSYRTYLRLGLVPEGLLKGWENMTSLEIANYKMDQDEDLVLAMAIIIPEGATNTDKGERLLFMIDYDEETWPLEECHIEQRDGRWLGYGEVEKQLENQISRNLNANLRRRGILWATKKIFYSNDENIQSNLVMEVRDGDVLQLGSNKTIAQLNTASQHTGEIQNDDSAVEENSKQISFAFEVATGEALPSGTPFRLGVVLQQAVASHFSMVRETFSNFLQRSFFDQIIPIFQAEYKDEHEVIVSLGDSDIQNMREELISFHTNERIFNDIMAGKNPNRDLLHDEVESELAKSEYAFLKVPKRAYEKPEYYMKLNLTDDIGPEISDLTTLHQTLTAKGDPRADQVLARIFALRGKPLASIIGSAPKPQAALPAPGGASPGGMPPIQAAPSQNVAA